MLLAGLRISKIGTLETQLISYLKLENCCDQQQMVTYTALTELSRQWLLWQQAF